MIISSMNKWQKSLILKDIISMRWIYERQSERIGLKPVEDPFGIVFEICTHSYELTYSSGA
jgi:hypothetical protein